MEGVTWTGAGSAPSVWRSSGYSSRAFCPTCGSTIGALDDKPVIGLVTGAFDKPGAVALKPKTHSYVSVKPHWWHVSAE